MSCCVCDKKCDHPEMPSAHSACDDENHKNKIFFLKSCFKWKADKALICQMAASILSTGEHFDYESQKKAIRRAEEIARLVEEDDEI